ncbi:uncharacterized protein [Chelonus insularis]|uniref:uncharacterized protein n=1 Tax=Chelonus insularis TaxID=460826 RepID=UPI00158BA532|nr:uncharacterized protein LOC118074447 [Chelonus insularis]
MIVYLILGLLLTSVRGEKKINLEDIEQDNLRSESKSSSELQKTSYSVKPKPPISSDDYRSSTLQYQNGGGGGLGSFTTAKPPHVNYQESGEYEQENLPTEFKYQQVNSVHDSSQYPEYTDQIEVMPKSNSQFNYQQQLYYEPEISVGNQYQTIQQKTATEKYLSNGYKSTIYIPMNQILAYYPHLSLGQGSSGKSESFLHQLANQVGQQIPIPLYTSGALSRTSIYMPSKLTYKIQPQHITYASQYPLHTQAIISGKKQTGRLYSQDTQPKDLLTTQTVIAQPHSQYLQELLYSSPLYTQTNLDQLKTYATTPVYVKSHSNPHSSILQQYTQYMKPKKLQYVVPLAKSTYHSNGNTHQNSDASKEGLTPPQLPAQNFKFDHYSISGESDREHYVQNHDNELSEPQSLLDSYIPSHVIAAKDAERYRERPIKLESGFLPSKISLIHSYKKRKTNSN